MCVFLKFLFLDLQLVSTNFLICFCHCRSTQQEDYPGCSIIIPLPQVTQFFMTRIKHGSTPNGLQRHATKFFFSRFLKCMLELTIRTVPSS